MSKRGFAIGVAALVVLIVVLRTAMLLNARIDVDESQHLHAAWLVAQGQVPYRDFWEHHTPLLYYLLAPLTRALFDSPHVYVAARVVMTLAALAASALVYLLARPLGPVVAATAVVLLTVEPRVLESTTQVRPDVVALLGWVVTLLALVAWRRSGAPAPLWAAGLTLGATAAFTPKAAYAAVGVAALVVLTEARGARAIARSASAVARVAVGAMLPMAMLLAWLAVAGGGDAVTAFFRDVVVGNLGFPDPSRRGPLGTEGVALVILGVAGVALVARRLGRRVLDDPLHGPLLVPTAVVTALLLLPRTPAVYEYTWLPVLVPVAVYGALALHGLVVHARRSGDRRSALAAALAVVGAIVLPAAVSVADAAHDQGRVHVRDMRRELAYACPGEPVLDGTGLYVFRPAASRYPALVLGVRLWIGEGRISVASIVGDLGRARAPVALMDNRLASMRGGPIGDFVARYYVPRGDGLLLAGASVPARAPGATRVQLLRSTLYRMTASEGLEVTIDGASVRPGLLPLAAGAHDVAWAGRAGTIELAASSCAERRAYAGTS